MCAACGGSGRRAGCLPRGIVFCTLLPEPVGVCRVLKYFHAGEVEAQKVDRRWCTVTGVRLPHSFSSQLRYYGKAFGNSPSWGWERLWVWVPGVQGVRTWPCVGRARVHHKWRGMQDLGKRVPGALLQILGPHLQLLTFVSLPTLHGVAMPGSDSGAHSTSTCLTLALGWTLQVGSHFTARLRPPAHVHTHTHAYASTHTCTLLLLAVCLALQKPGARNLFSICRPNTGRWLSWHTG